MACGAAIREDVGRLFDELPGHYQQLDVLLSNASYSIAAAFGREAGRPVDAAAGQQRDLSTGAWSAQGYLCLPAGRRRNHHDTRMLRCTSMGLTVLASLAAVTVGAGETRGTFSERRVHFAPGAHGATLQGQVTQNEAMFYIVRAKAGQLMTVKLDGDAKTSFDLSGPRTAAGKRWRPARQSGLGSCRTTVTTRSSSLPKIAQGEHPAEYCYPECQWQWLFRREQADRRDLPASYLPALSRW